MMPETFIIGALVAIYVEVGILGFVLISMLGDRAERDKGE